VIFTKDEKEEERLAEGGVKRRVPRERNRVNLDPESIENKRHLI